MLKLIYKNVDKRPLWLVESYYLIGSANDCSLRIDDAHVLPMHAELMLEGDTASLRAFGDGAKVIVNKKPLSGVHKLIHGDSIIIGGVEFEILDPKVQLQNRVESTVDEPYWALKPLNTALAKRQFRIDRSVVLGRSKKCDICLGVAHLSRRHAQLTEKPDGVYVEDLGSSNGTFINGTRIKEGYLKSGDELHFGTLRFQLVKMGGEASRDDGGTKTLVTKLPFGMPTNQSRKPASAAAGGIAMGSAIEKQKFQPVISKRVMSDDTPTEEFDIPMKTRYMLAGGLSFVVVAAFSGLWLLSVI